MILIALVTIAMISDICYRKISNRLILCGMIICMAKALGSFSLANILQVVINLSVPVFVLYLLYLLGVIGAGDIKLFSVISGFIGIIDTAKVAMIAFMIGGIWSIVILVKEHAFSLNMYAGVMYLWQSVRGNLVDYNDFEVPHKDLTIPFSVCIALGVYLVLLLSIGR